MIIAPSVLAFDFSKFEENIAILNEKCEWIHFDVMDGHFVDNLSFGPHLLNSLRKYTSSLIDAHLMTEDPLRFSDMFINAGADLITFHFEALNNDVDKCKEVIDHIKSKYVKVGLSIKPNTPVELIEPLLEYLDLVLVMSVEPGKGGQEFMTGSYDKISKLKKYKEEKNFNYLIQVDGGINDKNAHEIIEKGADVLVMGSFLFTGDLSNNIDKIYNCVQ